MMYDVSLCLCTFYFQVVVGTDETYAACWNSSTYGTAILNKLEELGLSRNDEESFYTLWQQFTHRISGLIAKGYSESSESSSSTLDKLIIWGGSAEVGSKVTYNMVDRADVVVQLPAKEYIIEVA